MRPGTAVPVLVVALLVAGCTSEPSAAQKSAASQNAKQQAIAKTDLQKAVATIKQCVRDGDGDYPAAVKDQSGTITLLCGPMGRSIQLAPGSRLTYKPIRGGFTVEIIGRNGSKADYQTPVKSPSS